MHAHHLGNEPLEARSALHLRQILSAFGALVLTAAAVYAFILDDPQVVFLGGLSAVFAIVAMIDFYVVTVELRNEKKPRGRL